MEISEKEKNNFEEMFLKKIFREMFNEKRSREFKEKES